jgi:hypothetical protein
MMWTSISHRLLLPISYYSEIECLNVGDDPLAGIIAHLTAQHGGNVAQNGIVNITSKSLGDLEPVSTVADLDCELFDGEDRGQRDTNWDSWFHSDDEPLQWVCWDFGEMRVRPTHYTLYARWLRHWSLEGSLDGKNWTEIDRQTGCQRLIDPWGNSIASFAVWNPMDCRFIRLTQTGKSECFFSSPPPDDRLRLSAVEFFGTLRVPNQSSSAKMAVAKTPKIVDCPMTERRRLDGIISYLTKKHGGNVHDRGIVAITASSVVHPRNDAKMAADADFSSWFLSRDEPGQWVCWDFREMRVRPTHYSIATSSLRSWLLEGSVDGERWAEFDRQTDRMDFMFHSNCPEWGITPFAVANPLECRFIRLTQTGESAGMRLDIVEFFGTLSE